MADNNFYSNFTERQRIKTSDAVFKIKTVRGLPDSFTTELNLQSYDFDEASNVIVDVYSTKMNSRLSFQQCGTIGNMRQMENVSLERLESEGLIKFTVKVVAPDDFVIQGLIEGISTYHTEETGDVKDRAGNSRNSLLPVNYGATDLGQIPCRLRFEDSSPFLDINESIDDAGQRMVNTPFFKGVQFPLIVETIVEKAFLDLDQGEIGDGGGWQEKWAKFAIIFMGGEDPRESEIELPDWVFNMSKKFAEKWTLRDSLDDYLREVYAE